MAQYAIIRNGVPELVPTHLPFIDSKGVQHPAAIFSVWKEAELNAIGLYGVFESEVPVNSTIISSSLVLDQGAVVRVYQFEEKTLDQFKQEKIALLAAKRYEVETGGIVVAGQNIRTDRESQMLINGAYNYSQTDPGIIINFKTPTGFVQLTPDIMKIIATTAAEHVQKAFAHEGELTAQIMATTTKEQLDAIDINLGW